MIVHVVLQSGVSSTLFEQVKRDFADVSAKLRWERFRDFVDLPLLSLRENLGMHSFQESSAGIVSAKWLPKCHH